MLHYKYIKKRNIVIAYVVLIGIYILLRVMGGEEKTCYYQHPYFTILLYGCFFLSIFKMDLTNPLYVTRHASVHDFLLKNCKAMVSLVWGYVSILCCLLLPISLVVKDHTTLATASIFYVYTLLSLSILSCAYFILSFQMGALLTKILLIGSLFAGIAVNFISPLFITVNFLFFNVNAAWNIMFVIQTASVYGIVICALYGVTRKRKEL